MLFQIRLKTDWKVTTLFVRKPIVGASHMTKMWKHFFISAFNNDKFAEALELAKSAQKIIEGYS